MSSTYFAFFDLPEEVNLLIYEYAGGFIVASLFLSLALFFLEKSQKIHFLTHLNVHNKKSIVLDTSILTFELALYYVITIYTTRIAIKLAPPSILLLLFAFVGGFLGLIITAFLFYIMRSCLYSSLPPDQTLTKKQYCDHHQNLNNKVDEMLRVAYSKITDPSLNRKMAIFAMLVAILKEKLSEQHDSVIISSDSSYFTDISSFGFQHLFSIAQKGWVETIMAELEFQPNTEDENSPTTAITTERTRVRSQLLNCYNNAFKDLMNDVNSKLSHEYPYYIWSNGQPKSTRIIFANKREYNNSYEVIYNFTNASHCKSLISFIVNRSIKNGTSVKDWINKSENYDHILRPPSAELIACYKKIMDANFCPLTREKYKQKFVDGGETHDYLSLDTYTTCMGDETATARTESEYMFFRNMLRHIMYLSYKHVVPLNILGKINDENEYQDIISILNPTQNNDV